MFPGGANVYLPRASPRGVHEKLRRPSRYNLEPSRRAGKKMTWGGQAGCKAPSCPRYDNQSRYTDRARRPRRGNQARGQPQGQPRMFVVNAGARRQAGRISLRILRWGLLPDWRPIRFGIANRGTASSRLRLETCVTTESHNRRGKRSAARLVPREGESFPT
jgi:hypothetical protein